MAAFHAAHTASRLDSPKDTSPMPAPDSQSRGGLSPKSAGLAPPSPYPQHVDPSPTESSGTDTTDIDQEAQDDVAEISPSPGGPEAGKEEAVNGAAITSPTSPGSLAKLDTTVSKEHEPGSDDAPQSVIHIPLGFKDFDSRKNSPRSATSNRFIASPSTPDAAKGPDDKRLSGERASPDNKSTDTLSTTRPMRQDSVTESQASLTSPTTSGTVTVSEARKSGELDIQVVNVDGDLTYRDAGHGFNEVSSQLRELRNALSEMWTLCNTLASMSASYRSTVFATSSTSNLQETAWNSCWRLCQELYEYQSQPLTNIHKTIELCREFTQARFEARPKGDLTSDAILRVSFEMCNHLYNVRDRSLPPPFVKRTMDFYVAFCHRMMKQRSALPQETDALLRASWTLAEALYHLQYPSNDEHVTEEDLVGSAVQACWDLSDLFREGWTHSKGDRGTPRPTQTTFSTRSRRTLTASEGRTSSLSNRTYHDATSFPQHQPPLPPETPITIFDDITESSSPESTHVPNILVLGPDDKSSSRSRSPRKSRDDRWSSTGSSLSDFSEDTRSSRQSASTTTLNETENYYLRMLRVLLLKAALDAGFSPFTASSPASPDYNKSPVDSLQPFVEALPKGTFGNHPHQLQLFEHYRGLVLTDPSLRNIGGLLGGRYRASDIAKAVKWLSDSNREQWSWMRDLHRHVMGSGIEKMDRSSAELEL